MFCKKLQVMKEKWSLFGLWNPKNLKVSKNIPWIGLFLDLCIINCTSVNIIQLFNVYDSFECFLQSYMVNTWFKYFNIHQHTLKYSLENKIMNAHFLFMWILNTGKLVHNISRNKAVTICSLARMLIFPNEDTIFIHF